MTDALRAMLDDLAADAPGAIGAAAERQRAAVVRRRARLVGVAALVLLGGVVTFVVQQDERSPEDRLVTGPTAGPVDRPPEVVAVLRHQVLAAYDSATGRQTRILRPAPEDQTRTLGAPVRLGAEVVVTARAQNDACQTSVVAVPLAGGPERTLASEPAIISSLLASDDPDLVGYVTGACEREPDRVLVLLRDGARRQIPLPAGWQADGMAYDRSTDGGNVVVGIFPGYGDPRSPALEAERGTLRVLGPEQDSFEQARRLAPPSGCEYRQPTPGRRAGEVLFVQGCGPTSIISVLALDTQTMDIELVATLPGTEDVTSLDLDPSGEHLLVDETSPRFPRIDGPTVCKPLDNGGTVCGPAQVGPTPPVLAKDQLWLTVETGGEFTVTRVRGGAARLACWG